VAQFLTDTLNQAFGRGKRVKPEPTTKMVAIFDGAEQDILKDRNGLWTIKLEGERYQNSRLGDLIDHIESNLGGTAERRPL
jgi:hypothetical protein